MTHEFWSKPTCWTPMLTLLLASCSHGGSGTSTDSASDTTTHDSETESQTETTSDEPNACTGPKVFKDPRLAAAVKEVATRQVEGFDGEFTPEVLASIKILGGEGSGSGMASLEGIQCLVNLESANFNINAISDLSPLAGLTKLTELKIEDNAVEDLSPLAGLSSLERLWIDRNAVEDLSALTGLSNLRMFTANDNFIKDVSPLTGLSSLKWLQLSRNPLENPEALSVLTNLKTLCLDGCGLSSVEFVANMASLIMLTLSSNSIQDITPLSGLDALVELHLVHNNLVDVSPLGSLDSLMVLDISDNRVESIEFLEALGPRPRGQEMRLFVLGIANNEITTLAPLAHLDPATTAILSLEGIPPSFDPRGVLDVSGNRLTDASPLRPLLEDRAFKRIPVELFINDNEIENLDFVSVSGLGLGRLKADNNRISDAAVLVTSSVGELSLVNNRLSSLSFLLMMKAAKPNSLFWNVFVLGNPLDDIALTEEAPALCAALVDLYYGDGEYCERIAHPATLPKWNDVPEPAALPGAQVSCEVNHAWLAQGALPGLAHHGAVFAPSEPVKGEPVVLDTVTGLMWRRCAFGQTWNGTTCEGAVTAINPQQATEHCAQAFAGHNDWRVPDPTELLSLVDFSQPFPRPAIDSDAFPATFPGMHWSTLVRPLSTTIWQVNFYNGALAAAWAGPLEKAALRCVRGSSSLPVEARFRSEAETVVDTWTGLTWQRCAVGQTVTADACEGLAPRMTEAEAETACQGTFGGHSDWRLPELDELHSLVDYCNHGPAINLEAFPQASRGSYFTATPLSGDGDEKRWVVDMTWGGVAFVGSGSTTARVRCVRL